MVTLSNNEGKIVEIVYDKGITPTCSDKHGVSFVVGTPIITCNDPRYAEYLRVTIHKAINNIVHGALSDGIPEENE